MRLWTGVVAAFCLLAGPSMAERFIYESVWTSTDRAFVDAYVFNDSLAVPEELVLRDTVVAGQDTTITVRFDTTFLAHPARTAADRNLLQWSEPLIVVRTTSYFEPVADSGWGRRIVVWSARTTPGIDDSSRVFGTWECEAGEGTVTAGWFAGLRRCASYLPEPQSIPLDIIEELVAGTVPLGPPTTLTRPPPRGD